LRETGGADLVVDRGILDELEYKDILVGFNLDGFLQHEHPRRSHCRIPYTMFGALPHNAAVNLMATDHVGQFDRVSFLGYDDNHQST
jgi:hypothetical protein